MAGAAKHGSRPTPTSSRRDALARRQNWVLQESRLPACARDGSHDPADRHPRRSRRAACRNAPLRARLRRRGCGSDGLASRFPLAVSKDRPVDFEGDPRGISPRPRVSEIPPEQRGDQRADGRGDLTVVETVRVRRRLPVVRRDPDDDKLLECAVGDRAECLVTGDRDLLALGSYRGVQILSVRVFLEKAHL
jgi:hypothetical protein